MRAPSSPGFPQFPERPAVRGARRRPRDALAGRPRAHARTATSLDVTLRARRATSTVRRPAARTTTARVEGRRGRDRRAPLSRPRGLEPAARSACAACAALHVRIDVAPGARPDASPAGIRELRIPGVDGDARRCGRRCSPSGRSRAGRRRRPDLPVPAHDRRRPVPARPAARRGVGARSCATAATARRGLERVFSPPAARTWDARRLGDASPPDAPDSALDALVGVEGRVRLLGALRGPARVPGLERVRRHAAPVDRLVAGRPPRLARVGRRATPIDALTLDPVPGVRRPTRVRLQRAARDRSTSAPDGVVRLPAAARGRRFRLEILRAAFPPGTPGRDAAAPRGRDRRDPRRGPTRHACRAAARSARECVADRDASAADADRPARRGDASRTSTPAARCASRGCEPLALPRGRDAAVALPAGRSRRTCCGCARPARARPTARARAAWCRRDGRPAAAATASGSPSTAPARLVLAESYNRGRRASCDGRDLGEPEVGGGYGTAWRVPATCRDVDDHVRARTASSTRATRSRWSPCAACCSLLVIAPARARRPSPRAAATPDAAPARGCRRATRGADRRPGRRSRSGSCSPRAARRCSRSASSSCSGAGSAREPLALAGGAVLGDRRADPHRS